MNTEIHTFDDIEQSATADGRAGRLLSHGEMKTEHGPFGSQDIMLSINLNPRLGPANHPRVMFHVRAIIDGETVQFAPVVRQVSNFRARWVLRLGPSSIEVDVKNIRCFIQYQTQSRFADELPLGRDRLDQYATANLGSFGMALPTGFAGQALSSDAQKGISKVLENYSFPSLNVMFSAASRLLKTNKTNLVIGAALDEMECRVKITPLDKDMSPIEDPVVGTPLVQILTIEPREPEVGEIEVKEKKRKSGIFGDGVISLPSNIKGLPTPPAQIQFRPPERRVKFVFLEKAAIARHNECAWYLRQVGKDLKEGVHHGLAFLQVSRKVVHLKVDVTLSSDWQSFIHNQVETYSELLTVAHPPVPKTPFLTDFTDLSQTPVVLPRTDVKSLLRVDDREFDALVTEGELKAFGKDKDYVSRGSLQALLQV